MHFPIALLMVGFASELFGRLSGRSFFSRMGFYLLLLGTAGAVVSYLSGDAAGEGMEEGSLEAAVEEHEESALVTLILALAVTVIEAALVVSMILSGGAGAAAIARDTVYAAVMIVCNGVVGLCLLLGGLRHHVLVFRVDGTSPALSVLAALSVLVLVLPGFTTTTPGPTYSPSQLAFAGLMSLVLYAAFVFVQTVRHRDYFLPESGEEEHAGPP
ncbi:MAG TPA: hypothetical protein PK858_11910, partial [Saprospiraceae bacterium]|nr:hypothetical protein [Saprospiraceae bacterium]